MEIVWGHVKGDLDIYITQDGHDVSLRKVLEAEILNYEQGEPTKKAHVTPAGRKVEPRVSITETKHTASELKARAVGGPADAAQVPLRSKQGKSRKARRASSTASLLCAFGQCSFIRARTARSSCRPT